MQTRLSLADFPAAGPFLRAYADTASWSVGVPLTRWFHHNPHDPGCFAARIAELQALPADAQRSAALSRLAAAQSSYGADDAAVAGAEALAGPDCYAVVTGQQVGLFGGPLYTQLKALTAIKLAAQLQAQHPESRFVPVFWLATGDSDFDEVRRTTLLDRDELRTIELPPNGTHWDNQLVGSRDVAAHVSAALDELATALSQGEHRDEVLEAVREAYADGGLVAGFGRWLARLTRGTGLVIADSRCAPEVLAPLAVAELERAGQSAEALDARNSELVGAGFSLQVEQPADDTSLFLLTDGDRREKLVRDGDAFVLRPSGQRFSLGELLELARAEPQRFVRGVLLGPVYQDALLRPVAFIGGAAELAYRAQSTALFELHGRRSAPAFLRASATLLPARTAQFLDKLGWELSALYVPEQEVSGRAVAGEQPEQIRAALQDYLDVLHSADTRLKQLAVELDPNLEASFDTLRGNLIRHVEKLEKKLTHSLKQRSEGVVRRALQAHALAYPRHNVQERELSLLSFLPRHGFGLLPELLARLETPCWEHQIVTL